MKKMKTREVDMAALQSKEFWTTAETAAYLGISLSCLYKMTMKQAIPFSKPRGKMVYFKREQIIRWFEEKFEKCSVAEASRLSEQAQNLCLKSI